jgi:hypothetical protein
MNSRSVSSVRCVKHCRRDLIRTDKLQGPMAEMIALLVRLATGEPLEKYKIITDAAYEWGYENGLANAG